MKDNKNPNDTHQTNIVLNVCFLTSYRKSPHNYWREVSIDPIRFLLSYRPLNLTYYYPHTYYTFFGPSTTTFWSSNFCFGGRRGHRHSILADHHISSKVLHHWHDWLLIGTISGYLQSTYIRPHSQLVDIGAGNISSHQKKLTQNMQSDIGSYFSRHQSKYFCVYNSTFTHLLHFSRLVCSYILD